MRLGPWLAALAAAALLSGCRAEPQSPAGPPAAAAKAPSGLEIVPLRIRAGDQIYDFRVEVARSEEEQARGLMFRDRLGPGEGMLFPFVPARPASFWMKDTLIPLDMIFVRADGSIARVVVNTIPHSLDPVAVSEPVTAVLEIAGGRSVELGIDEYARVSWAGGPAR